LVDIIRELREQKGAGKPFDLRRLREKVEVIGPSVDLEQLNTSISVAIADRIGSSWDEWYGQLKAYKQREGHCQVPLRYRDEGGHQLGQWVRDQRKDKETMPLERRKRLEALGFVWNALDADWEEGFACLQRFHQREGHCRVPQHHCEDGYRLGPWVSNLRQAREKLPPERRQQLEELPFVWDAFDAAWEEGFAALERFRQRKGHCLVPTSYLDEQGYPLGKWVSHQRGNRNKISAEHRRRLDELGFVWDVRDAQWEEGFAQLQCFWKREGHCRVPARHREQGYPLGTWVSNQRKTKEKLPPECYKRLDDLGFVWKALDAAWEDGFAALERFQQREGHCLVPQSHLEQDFRLGLWVSRQRKVKERLSPERRQRLEALGFVWKVRSFCL